MNLSVRMAAMVFVATLVAFGARGAAGIAVVEVANHYPWDGKVDCVCTLSGLKCDSIYKGAFMLSVKKNGETLRRAVTNAFASVDGTYTNTFDCVELFGADHYPNGGITVELIKDTSKPEDATGDPIGIMSDVLVIDVSAGSDAMSYSTMELIGVDIGTFNCDVYKGDKIVLRKVPAGSYYCEPGAAETATVTQMFSTKCFYIGVFPVTQLQYWRVMGTNPSNFSADAEDNVAAHRPVEKVSWNTIRGSVAADSPITASSPDSFLQRLVAKTGRTGFDLPTEVQWEMSCRAGATAPYGAYWNGIIGAELSSSTIGEVAWYGDNASSTTHSVGGKRPNLWGLYDMQGNIFEWCRDIYYGVGESGEYRVARGGCWFLGAESCHPSRRYPASAADGYVSVCWNYMYGGFRLSMTLP